ncbi:MAG: GGDEF domain-containing protein [Gallionellaceae bacterium]|nr:GGDEF domain-containing protein [Gallionellaceae bacterium]
MKYQQDRNASAEILRLLIQKMAAHPAPFTPHTYTVWYEAVAGINPALSEDISHLLEKNLQITSEIIDKLYDKHVSDDSSTMHRVLHEGIHHLLGKIAGFTEETDRQASLFGNSLQIYGDTLKQPIDAPKLVALVSDMTGDTDKMRGSMQSLQSELVASKQQVEKLNKELQSARGEALTDPLTGILNRRGFEQMSKQALADKAGVAKGLCLLMVDIDHFKKINDAYGHLLGDKVIRAIAEALKSKIRGQDSVARIGGEEFAVLLTETDVEGAQSVANSVRKSIEKGKIRRLDNLNTISGITISIGIAKYNEGATMTDLLAQADEALYQSKEQGRNRVTVHQKNSD